MHMYQAKRGSRQHVSLIELHYHSILSTLLKAVYGQSMNEDFAYVGSHCPIWHFARAICYNGKKMEMQFRWRLSLRYS